MPLFAKDERLFAQRLLALSYSNPFLTERIETERALLGAAYHPVTSLWSLRPDIEADHPNIIEIAARVERMLPPLRERLARGERPPEADQELYENLVLYALFHRARLSFDELLLHPKSGKRGGRPKAPFYAAFADQMRHYFAHPGHTRPTLDEAAHLFACFFQIRRAFHHTYYYIIGESLPAARLRAAVWQSVFTRDMARYRRALYNRMGDITCLITGPSGTGKELVARAIGLSRFIPFDAASQAFTEESAGSFFPLNLSALSPTLIESELFGHRRGAYTGALDDREGWLEICPPLGTVFLDEIGELDPALQVKLLRVLESRRFQRLGETEERPFQGKIIAATNRDLAREMESGAFRPDLYYRLCADQIRTPSLHEQLRDSADFLPNMAGFLARRMVGEDEAEKLKTEVLEWIATKMPKDYRWPGNVRELEQCLRNILIRGEYIPRTPDAAEANGELTGASLARALDEGALTADELMSRYCTLIYARTGSYQETARRLGVDHRTVKSKIMEQSTD